MLDSAGLVGLSIMEILNCRVRRSAPAYSAFRNRGASVCNERTGTHGSSGCYLGNRGAVEGCQSVEGGDGDLLAIAYADIVTCIGTYIVGGIRDKR